MRRIFIGCFFLHLAIAHSQSIRIRLRNSTDQLPISGALNFIVDRNDSTVLGFAVSDENGSCTIPLLQPSKNNQVNLMIFGMGYSPFTILGIYPNTQKNVVVDLDLRPNNHSTELFQVLVDKKGHYCTMANPLLDSIPLAYYKEYLVLAEYYYQMGINEQQNYEKERVKYEQEIRKIDSLSKLGRDIGYIMPPEPKPPEPFYNVEYLALSPEKSIQVSIDGGWENFYNYFISNKQFQSQLRKNGGLKVWLSTDSGYEPYLDTVVISASKKGPIKGLRKLCYQILEKKLIMQPVVLGGNKVKLQDEMSFYIQFIYRKE